MQYTISANRRLGQGILVAPKWGVQYTVLMPLTEQERASKLVPLTNGGFATVSAIDYRRVSQQKWCLCTSKGCKYVMSSHSRGKKSLHRFVMRARKGIIIDHINRNTLDNRRDNLRACSIAQSNMNRRGNVGGSSRFKGVHWYESRQRWKCSIKVCGKQYYLGEFHNEQDAAITYNVAAQIFFGEFAYLNNV